MKKLITNYTCFNIFPIWMMVIVLFYSDNIDKNANQKDERLDAENQKRFGAYIGEKPPGLIPKVFADGFISTNEHEFSCTFSADGKEFYFNRNKNIWFTQLTDKGWSLPHKAEFCSSYLDNEPHIIYDNKYLFFGSRRPHPHNNLTSEYSIWLVERVGDAWSLPKYVGPASYVSSEKNGTIYTRNIIPEYRK